MKKNMKVIIEPYNTEMGVYWRIVNAKTKKTIDDGFDSTADTEMYCFDNNLDYNKNK